MHRECFQCDIKQMTKVSQFLLLDKNIEDLLIRKTNEYLLRCDMKKTNPEIMSDIWEIVNEVICNDNPYKKVKSYYNQYISSLLDDIKDYINLDIKTALKVTIAANLIDFSVKDKISQEDIENVLLKARNMTLAIDDSDELFLKLQESRKLLYLGDNCGEIVLDKLFISMLKEKYPYLNVYYGVRGKAIVNDVTMDDANEINMHEVAHVVSNGDGSLGTVLSRTSHEFKELFQDVDVVICKGQGNYEGLIDCDKENLFFLFMSKCQLVSDWSHTKLSDIVCMKKINQIEFEENVRCIFRIC